MSLEDHQLPDVASPCSLAASGRGLSMKSSFDMPDHYLNLKRKKHKIVKHNSKKRILSASSLQENLIDHPERSDWQIFLTLVANPWSFLFIFQPLGIICPLLNLTGDVGTFWINFLAMVPLAKLLGDATEELAEALKNDIVAGLLNATFGNACEMIICIQALRKGLFMVVKNTLTGSILSNLLLVLGMSFFAGGLGDKNREQRFAITGTLANMTLLFLATIAMGLPTLFAYEVTDYSAMLTFSRSSSICMTACYIAYLLFQLHTHVDMFREDVYSGVISCSSYSHAKDYMSLKASLLLLFFCTVVVAFQSEFLVSSIEGLTDNWNLSIGFIGVILLPIVGNACEHFSAVKMAMEDRMSITVGIAIGSSTQIAAFVAPLLVLLGWVLGLNMDNDYGSLNVVLTASSVILTFFIVSDGRSNWLEGFCLIAAYLIISLMFFYTPEKSL